MTSTRLMKAPEHDRAHNNQLFWNLAAICDETPGSELMDRLAIVNADLLHFLGATHNLPPLLDNIFDSVLDLHRKDFARTSKFKSVF
ncbi:unnamed protein product [Soboliphyme baturini]|uniref:BLUF domain-containing protein n=1 Tax=Soboliphyme baturini TaxID=241478 RepID=A0A183IDJ2_9BILA|nr:unnamed protein product [Soboliphyme baturini]